MAINDIYVAIEPTRAEIEAFEGPTLIEFGSPLGRDASWRVWGGRV